jgi:hypothetical protein
MPAPTDAAIKGKVIFSADWNGELGTGWQLLKEGSFVRNENVKYEFVQDPLDSSRMCMKYTVTGPSIAMPGWLPANSYWQNSYASWVNAKNVPVSAFEVKFFYPPSFGRSIGLLGDHGTKSEVTGIGMNPDRSVYVSTLDGEGTRRNYQTSTFLEPNTWHTLRIEYRNNKTYFLVNGRLIFTANLIFQVFDVHAGWQFAQSDPKLYHNIGEWMCQKDFVVETPN